MKIGKLIGILGSDERARAVGQIGNYESPSFVLRHLAEWMTTKPDPDPEWEELAASLRAKAYELEGRGL